MQLIAWKYVELFLIVLTLTNNKKVAKNISHFQLRQL